MAACALSAGAREAEYLESIQGLEPEVVRELANTFGALQVAMEYQPYTDLLGPIYMEIGSRSTQKWGGEFYTPHCLTKLMARMTFSADDVPADRPLAVCEPACGSGGTILSLADAMAAKGISPLCMRATCIDINRLSCDMCFVNLTLWGIPAEVIHGNTLSLETWGGWRNFLWWQAHGRTPRLGIVSALDAVVQTLSEPAPTVEATIEKAENFTFDKVGQGGFDFDFGQKEDRKSA